MGTRNQRPAAAATIALTEGARITVHAFPNDARFIRDIATVLDEQAFSGDSAEGLPDRVRQALRAWYPQLEIRVRDDLASLSDLDRVWYVLRDGRVGVPHDRLDAGRRGP